MAGSLSLVPSDPYPSIKFWVSQMKIRSVLVVFGNCKHRGFVKEPSYKGEDRRQPFLGESVGQHHAGVPGESCKQQNITVERGRNVEIEIVYEFRHILDDEIANAIRLDVFYSRN